jgi:hypothetical protein
MRLRRLLGFCYSALGVLPLCAAVTTGAAASAIWLVYKREALLRQRYLIPIALLASVGSVATGFIIIFLVVLTGSIFH